MVCQSVSANLTWRPCTRGRTRRRRVACRRRWGWRRSPWQILLRTSLRLRELRTVEFTQHFRQCIESPLPDESDVAEEPRRHPRGVVKEKISVRQTIGHIWRRNGEILNSDQFYICVVQYLTMSSGLKRFKTYYAMNIQRCTKRLVNLAKQDPSRARQSS